MKSNWLRNVAVIVSLVCSTAFTTAFADHKHGSNSGGSFQSFQGSGNGNVARSLGSQSLGSSGLGTFKPQIKTLSGNLGQLGGSNTHSLGVTNGPKLSGITLGTQTQFKPNLTTKIGGLNGLGGSKNSQLLNSQLLNSN